MLTFTNGKINVKITSRPKRGRKDVVPAYDFYPVILGIGIFDKKNQPAYLIRG